MRNLSFLVALVALAGCFGSSGTQAPGTSGPAVDEAPCDFRVEPARIRAREIDLAVDPNDAQRLAAGMMVSIPSTRMTPPDDEPVWTRIVRSGDGGKTWDGADLSGWPGDPGIATSPFAGSAIVGDPVLAFLPDGTLLLIGIMIQADYNYAMFSARFEGDGFEPSDVVILSRGAWGDPRLNPIPSPGSVLYNDKEEVAIDPATGVAYASWMWRFNDPQEGTQSIPVVVMTTDGGKTWTAPKTLFGGLGGGLTADQGNIGQFPFITSDGQTHIAWYASGTGGMMVASAPTGTLDFGEPRAIVSDVELDATSAAISIPIPSVAVGPGAGGVGESTYVVWSDSRHGDADVLIIRSDDGAQTWTEPVRANTEPVGDGTEQLVPVVAVSAQGTVGVHFISFAAAGDAYDARASWSYDGGSTFWSAIISSDTTLMSEATGQRGSGIQGHVGDYFGAAFSNETFVAMWQDGRDGSSDEPFTAAYACRLETGPSD